MIAELLTYISGNFLESLVIFLLVSLFFKETIILVFKKYFGAYPDEDQRRTLKMASEMSELKLHFNDETTHILTDIQVLLAKGEKDHGEIKNSMIGQHGQLEEIRDTLRDMQRNGIRLRR